MTTLVISNTAEVLLQLCCYLGLTDHELSHLQCMSNVLRLLVTKNFHHRCFRIDFINRVSLCAHISHLRFSSVMAEKTEHSLVEKTKNLIIGMFDLSC
jgi:hypothetical protein